ncbi:MAG: YdcF family protein [Traorella sp.]
MILLLFLIILLPIIYFPKCPKEEGYVDCLIVLGCPAYENGEMSITQKLRVEKAAEVISKYQISVCILTGGAAHNAFSEAKIMQTYLDQLVSVTTILEDQSTTTYENMKNCQKLCEDNHYQTIGILTSRYHANRAYAMSKKFFKDVVIFEAPYRFTFKKIFREFLSRYQYMYIELKKLFK